MSRSHAFYVSKRRHLRDQEATLSIELSVTWLLFASPFVHASLYALFIDGSWLIPGTWYFYRGPDSGPMARRSSIFERSTASRDGSYLDQAILKLFKVFEVQDDKKWEIIFLQATFLSKFSYDLREIHLLLRRVLFCQDLSKRVIKIERSTKLNLRFISSTCRVEHLKQTFWIICIFLMVKKKKKSKSNLLFEES